MSIPFKELFLSIQQRISDAVPAIAFIDQDLGQLSNKARPPVSWPCVLIDFENFRFKNLAENVQTAKGTIVLRLGFAPHSASSQITPKTPKQLALSYYELEWAIHLALHGWTPDGGEFGALSRTTAITQPRTDAYRVRELRYKIAFDDYSTKPVQQYAPAAIATTEQFTR